MTEPDIFQQHQPTDHFGTPILSLRTHTHPHILAMGSNQSSPAPPPPTAANMAADLKSNTAGTPPAKPKPCCVCTDEKAKRDECMLFSNSSDPQAECKDLVTKYKDCMAGYGFKI
ncbi:unnamed protein product [Periconia digitata]|uniref:Cytochrome c oxidase copper chaperone n=1 Tax=Periconia digitata TaxID=1303443 RepID=A0A9W4UAS4_9PLEO|nr:unnamed protein product [Periconia digitata]